MNDCLFCKIINKEIPAKVLYESESVVAFPDIKPAADIHILIVPKKHFANIKQVKNNEQILSQIYQAVDRLVEDNNLDDNLYRIVVNGGKAQHIPHLHFHLLGGEWKEHI